MANLNKLLVHVPSSLCEDFRNKYIKDGANRDKSYDSKVVFLEDTKEIFTKGKIYGINVEDFNALKKLIGTIPSEGGTTSTNIVDYINKKFSNLDTAAYKPVSYFDGAGAAADVKRELLGTESDAYTYNTIYGLRKYAIYQAQSYSDTVALSMPLLMPEVTAGTGIIVNESTVPPHGKKIYTVSTSAELFHYKGNKTTITELLSTGNKTGDVWSVGPINATGSTLYAWDGDEWINLGGANGVTGVDETSCYGVKLVKNQNGTVKAYVTTGSVVSGNDLVVTGGTVYNYINNLGGNASSGSTSSYVNVTVNTSGGKVKKVTVEDTKALKDAVSYALSAVQTISGDSPFLSAIRSGSYVGLSLDKTEIFNYVANNIWETYSQK